MIAGCPERRQIGERLLTPRIAMFLRYVLPILALAMLAFAVFHVVRTYPVQPTAPPPLPPPESPFARALAATGIVEAASGNVAVAAPSPGVVAEVFVQAGQPVSAGAPLFRLDDRALQAEHRAREARLTAAQTQQARLEQMPRRDEVAASAARVGEARANLGGRQAELDHGQRLFKDKLINAQELERLQQARLAAQEQLSRVQAEDRQLRAGAWEADRAVARATVAEARSRVDQAKTVLERLTVRAPLAATVLQVNVHKGEAVGEKSDRPPLILGNISTLHLRVDVEEHQIAHFRADGPATALPRGQTDLVIPLRFVRIEPLVVARVALKGDSGERSDTRVLQVLYEFDPGKAPVYVGELMDVFIGQTE
jgi:HlyD family secretion protein